MITDLVIADHILSSRGVLRDGEGHVSVRSARNPGHFYMTHALDPGVARRQDVVELDQDSRAVNPANVRVYSERFIHGEIYRVRPDVQSVIHSHAPAVLPFGVTDQPLQALIHTAYFLGCKPAPVFDLAAVQGENNQMLVDNMSAGAALARTLRDRSVALMRGHGMVVVGPSIQDSVFRAIYTVMNAEAEQQALLMGKPRFMNCHEVTRSEAVTRQWSIWSAQEHSPLD